MKWILQADKFTIPMPLPLTAAGIVWNTFLWQKKSRNSIFLIICAIRPDGFVKNTNANIRIILYREIFYLIYALN